MEQDLESLKEELLTSAYKWHGKMQKSQTRGEQYYYRRMFDAVTRAYDDVNEALKSLQGMQAGVDKLTQI